jgi:hypothetical protein
MISTPDPLTTVRGDLQLLNNDLDCIRGALSEIATVWRRAHPSRPELPLGLPEHLEDGIGQLAASVQALVDVGPGQPPDLAFSLAGRLAALKQDIRDAEAMTCGDGAAPLGDAQLWSYLGEALHRAGNRLLALIVQLARIEDWSLSGPAAVLPDPDRVCLLVRLGTAGRVLPTARADIG